MTISFVNKTYYQSILSDEENMNPVQSLGKLLHAAQQDGEAELSQIRFAQGEMYYHQLDLETAIYKWQNVTNELSGWAQKNIGDTYYDLRLTEDAKQTYKAIESEDDVLSVEVALQLLSIYAEESNKEQVYHYTSRALAINPDYPNVTDLAKTVYEDYEDWPKAIDLALSEGERTNETDWYRYLLRYVEAGYTAGFTPEYFESAMKHVYTLDRDLFIQLIAALTKTYRNKDTYLYWVGTLNTIFATIELDTTMDWELLAALHHDIYLDLTSGAYLEREIEPILPYLVQHWEELAIRSGSGQTLSTAARVAWQDTYPDLKNETMVEQKEDAALAVEEMLKLLEDVVIWSEDAQVDETVLIKLREDLSQLPGVGAQFVTSSDLTFDRVKWLEALRRNANDAEGEKARQMARELSSTIQRFLQRLLNQQVAAEGGLEQQITFFNEMLTKLRGLKTSVEDLREEKKESVIETYQRMKDMQKEQLMEAIPRIIKDTESLLDDEDRSIRTIHEELNDEMNNRIYEFANVQLLPVFKQSLERWTQNVEAEFKDTQQYFDEMNESFNNQFNEERLKLHLDAQLFADWKRDLRRMVNRAEFQDENIMNRLEPKQLLLRNVGKLFGDMQQNRQFLIKQYRSYIQNDSFEEVAESISHKLFFEFDLFEKAIKSDVDAAFTDLIDHIDDLIASYEEALEQTEIELQELREHPEKFYDPLKIFDLRQKQCAHLLGDRQDVME
ncbi:hypothetical protein FLK61_27935 [Paenalkalicoccus suaedae]|uniref:Tetratricopeptide repeat protein n=1 Tax=Paenalkalicoccus suaedae TaxID=2592382 RepID=A0A859FDC9_9BACI|nr:hypothetical protein [Paenalkalicoccus suaedae]QKS70584.1 hypothetical protein FLK61_27935 [Paenalkalicoccus suaedae]